MIKLKYIILCPLVILVGVFSFWFFYEPADNPLPTEVPLWMQQRITKELTPFKANGVTKEKLDQASIIINTVTNNELIRYQIINNELYIQTSNLSDKAATHRSEAITNTLKRILKHTKIENIDFVITMHDSYKDAINNFDMPPIFTFAANKKINKDKNILFIDDYSLYNNKIGYRTGWKSISKEILKANKDYPWNKKIDKAFWRGKLSDDQTDHAYRSKLVDYSIELPKDFDAKFTQTNSPKPKNKLEILYEVISLELSIPPFVSRKDQVHYKMLINLDGYTSTYPGFLWRLLSNSVTIKQETDNEQWFYDAVKPWIHYVPVKQDLSDLLEKVEWIKAHDDEARKIAERSTEFVQNNLMPEHLDLYIVTLLNEYSKLQRFKLDKPTLPKA
jgi:protein glucosyltransferase